MTQKPLQNEVNRLNDKIIQLWERNAGPKTRFPMLYPEMSSNSLLFIGLNPSFSERGFRRILADTQFKNIDPHKLYDWKNRDDKTASIAIAIEKIAKDKYAYFAKFHDIARELNCNWNHIDLLFTRETNQNAVRKMLFDKSGNMSPFATAQLDISSELIDIICPSMIMIANACASEIVRNMMVQKLSFDDEYGYHFLTGDTQHRIPIFFSSMLTGQRALDNGSYERLKWHMGFVYNKLYR